MVIFLALIRGFSFAWRFAGSKRPARGMCKTNVDGLPLTPPGEESSQRVCRSAVHGHGGPPRGLCGQGGGSWAQDLLVLQITGAPGRPGNGRCGCVRTHVAEATAEGPRSAHPEALDIPSTGLPRPSLAPGTGSPPASVPSTSSVLTQPFPQPSVPTSTRPTAIGCSITALPAWQGTQRSAPRPWLPPRTSWADPVPVSPPPLFPGS